MNGTKEQKAFRCEHAADQSGKAVTPLAALSLWLGEQLQNGGTSSRRAVRLNVMLSSASPPPVVIPDLTDVT